MAGYIGTQAVSVNTTSATISDDLSVGDDATIAGTLGVTGVLTATSLDISGAIDVDGVSNLDVVDIDGAVNMATTALVTGVLTTTAAAVFNGGFTSNGASTIAGTTPTLTIGDAGAEDAKIVFDGNAVNFHIGNDDSADTLKIGTGTALGTTPRLSISTSTVIVNELGVDVNTSIRSNGNDNMIFVDGGNNNVGIGRAPATSDGGAGSLQIEGNDGLAMRRNGQTHSFLMRPRAGSVDGMRFTQGGTGDVMTIDTDGRLGIGNTSPGSILDCATNESNFIARFNNAGDNVNRLGIFVQTGKNDGSGTNVFFAAYTAGGAETGQLRSVDGTFQLVDTSDRRLKQDIVDTAVNGITSVNAMKVRDFAYKTNPTVTVEAGFIAQELQEVFSPSVSYSESDSDRILSVSRERLVPVLVKAIQEQNALIVALTARVTTLEG